MISPPFWSWSTQEGLVYLGILIVPQDLPSFVSEITIPMIIFVSNSDLFLEELMLGSATVIHISLKLFNEVFSSIQRGSMGQKWVNKISLPPQILLTRKIVFVLLQFIIPGHTDDHSSTSPQLLAMSHPYYDEMYWSNYSLTSFYWTTDLVIESFFQIVFHWMFYARTFLLQF